MSFKEVERREYILINFMLPSYLSFLVFFIYFYVFQYWCHIIFLLKYKIISTHLLCAIFGEYIRYLYVLFRKYNYKHIRLYSCFLNQINWTNGKKNMNLYSILIIMYSKVPTLLPLPAFGVCVCVFKLFSQVTYFQPAWSFL